MISKREPNDDGFTTIEAALVMPTVFLMLLLMVQGLFAVLQNRSVQLAAEQAADAAARFEATDGDGQVEAQEILDELGVKDATIVITRTADNVEVTVEAEIPKMVLSNMMVTGSASAPIEEFLDLGERS